MNITEIQEKITALADEDYRSFHSRLLPDTDNVAGVRLPLLRKLAKEIAKESWQEYWNIADREKYMYYEEAMLKGLVLCAAKMSFKQRLHYIAEFVPEIDNWAVCDSFCCSIKDTKNHLSEMRTFLTPYFSSTQEFEVRFATVMLLDYYIIPEYIDQTLAVLCGIRHPGYYVKMAVAWAISICFIKFPQETMALLKEQQSPPASPGLDDFTYNKAIQKICESYRVDQETKKQLRSMKRRTRV